MWQVIFKSWNFYTSPLIKISWIWKKFTQSAVGKKTRLVKRESAMQAKTFTEVSVKIYAALFVSLRQTQATFYFTTLCGAMPHQFQCPFDVNSSSTLRNLAGCRAILRSAQNATHLRLDRLSEFELIVVHQSNGRRGAPLQCHLT